jgi:hypothetical protein
MPTLRNPNITTNSAIESALAGLSNYDYGEYVTTAGKEPNATPGKYLRVVEQTQAQFVFPINKDTYIVSVQEIKTDQPPEPTSPIEQRSTHTDFHLEQTKPINSETGNISNSIDSDLKFAGLDLGYYRGHISSDQLSMAVNADAEDFCQRKALLSYIEEIKNMIWDDYRGVDHVNLELIQDREVPRYERLCFEIHIKSEPDQVLDDEDDFYNDFFSKIPQDKRDLFVFIYQVS